jgi:Ca-activated chloride channel family protein
MNKVIWVILFCLAASTSYSQFYLRGEIKDERGRLLEGVKITLASKGTFPYYSGNSGTFGISESVTSDTITLTLDGYETMRTFIDTRKFQNLFLKMLPTTAHLYNKKLSSFTTNLKAEPAGAFSVMGESYSNLVENNSIDADKYPETGFALNVDKASYSNIRRFLNNEMLVPTDAVRIEEMLNYFDFTKPRDALVRSVFTCRTQLTTCPWRPGNQLLFLNVSAPKLDLEKVPPSNLVFLIDISGSMDKPNRLPLLQSAFKLLADNLRKKDTITIVTYGGGVGIALQPTSGADKKKIKDVIDSLVASGDTPGAGAVRIAYDMA